MSPNIALRVYLVSSDRLDSHERSVVYPTPDQTLASPFLSVVKGKSKLRSNQNKRLRQQTCLFTIEALKWIQK